MNICMYIVNCRKYVCLFITLSLCRRCSPRVWGHLQGFRRNICPAVICKGCCARSLSSACFFWNIKLLWFGNFACYIEYLLSPMAPFFLAFYSRTPTAFFAPDERGQTSVRQLWQGASSSPDLFLPPLARVVKMWSLPAADSGVTTAVSVWRRV